MDFGGEERRTTKKDLKRKRIARGYKIGGKFRSANVDEVEAPIRQSVPLKGREKVDKMGKVIVEKKKISGKGKKKY